MPDAVAVYGSRLRGDSGPHAAAARLGTGVTESHVDVCAAVLPAGAAAQPRGGTLRH